ncbi:hypothetical protein D1AOALGA4SA_4988 [Olavius algarvensis Delta 1 endosymbiont]|nr:hypothetical protein D1AOALGA4SA_4988 [Olavius algarvensis Delta 1 endosymbiont]
MELGCQVSGVSPAAGQTTAGQIEKETSKKRISNIEQGITNVEGMYAIYLIKMTEQSDTTLHHSIFLVRYSAVRFK